MMLLVRAVVTGFGLSLGAMLFKKTAARLGFDDDKDNKDAARDVTHRDAATTDPSLQNDSTRQSPSA